MRAETFRNSGRHLFGTALVRVPTATLLMVVIHRSTSNWQGPWSRVLLALIALVTLSALLSTVLDALFRTMTIDSDVLTVKDGWLVPRTRRTSLDAITSVQVDEPLSQRLSGVRALTVLTAGAATTFEMPALRTEDANRLKQLLTGTGLDEDTHGECDSGPRTASAGPSSPAEQARSAVIYRAGVRDVVATAASTGYVTTLLVAAAGASDDVQEAVRSTGFELPAGGLATWVVGVAVISAGVAGMVALRFHAFSIHRDDGGHLTISYGLADRKRHTIAPEQVIAVSLVRTPADALFGTTRLVLSTGSPSGGDRRPLVFPSMPTRTVAEVIHGVLGRDLASSAIRQGRRWTVSSAIVVGSAAAACVVAAEVGVVLQIASTLAALVVGTAVVQYACADVTVNGDHEVVFSTTGLTSKVNFYLPGALTAVTERSAPGLGVHHLTMSGWAHRRVRHRLVARGATCGRLLRRAIRCDSPAWPVSHASGRTPQHRRDDLADPLWRSTDGQERQLDAGERGLQLPSRPRPQE